MREILFRGKVKGVDNTDKWVKGGFHIWEKRMPAPMGNDKLQENEISYVITINSFADWNMPRTMQAVEVMPETVGQYTGLKDKNGKKIFEGDVVKVLLSGSNQPVGVVKYGETGICGFGVITKPPYSNYLLDKSENFEIIGNIHDNPELLKGVRE